MSDDLEICKHAPDLLTAKATITHQDTNGTYNTTERITLEPERVVNVNIIA